MKLRDGDVIKCTACPEHGCTGRPVRVRVVPDLEYPQHPDLYHDGNSMRFGWLSSNGIAQSNYYPDIEVVGRRT